MELQTKIGLKIKELRENKQLSQAQLAEMVGYKDKTAIAKVEAGKVDLPQSKIIAFSKALGITPSYLLDEDYIPTTPINKISSHFNENEFTLDELNRIEEFANFVKSNRKK